MNDGYDLAWPEGLMEGALDRNLVFLGRFIAKGKDCLVRRWLDAVAAQIHLSCHRFLAYADHFH